MPLVAVIEQLSTRVKEYDRKVEELARDRYPDTPVLTQVCGVGSLTALAYILTLEDEQRYRRSRSVGAWLGLVPGQHDSGDSQPQRRITKEGDAYLRRLLVRCAQYILGPFASDSVPAVANWPCCSIGCGEPAKSTDRSTTPARKSPQRNHWTNGKSKQRREKISSKEPPNTSSPSPIDCDLPTGAARAADRQPYCSDQLERISACTQLNELTRSADGDAAHDVSCHFDRR
ncbi:MAG: transposase [Acidobacteriota bacterium]|jgi:hypothetical protein|nr:transposase [Acidobacteriota bacterium]